MDATAPRPPIGSSQSDAQTFTQPWLLYFQQVSDRLSDLMGSLSGGAVGDYQQTALDTLGPSWLLCDGSEVAKADYPALYELIGDMAGVAAGDGNFVLPSIDRIYAHPGDDKPIQRTFIRATV